MTHLNQFRQELRRISSAQRFLFGPFCRSRSSLAGFVSAILLALAATASAQINGTWIGADGATWNTTDTNWTGVTVPSTPWASPGTTANATFNATSGSASVSGTVFANTITYRPVGGNFLIANGTITLAGTTPTINNYDPSGTLTLSSTVSGSASICERRFAAEAWNAKGLAVPTRGSRGRRCATSGKNDSTDFSPKYNC